MDLVPARLRLQRRNVEVFDSHGAIIAGIYFHLDCFGVLHVLDHDDLRRVLAIWHS